MLRGTFQKKHCSTIQSLTVGGSLYESNAPTLIPLARARQRLIFGEIFVSSFHFGGKSLSRAFLGGPRGRFSSCFNTLAQEGVSTF